MIFKTPWILITIPFVLLFLFYVQNKQKEATFRFSSKFLLHSLGTSWKMNFMYLPNALRYLSVVLFIIALAGPRLVSEETIQKTEGIDIVLAIDASGSMAAEDFKLKGNRVNRLEVVKDVVGEFIEERKSDRIGLIAFAALAHTVTPLTTDYNWLQKNLERVDLGKIKDGTAIGSAIMSSVARLKNSDAKSKIIILLTDGKNNVTDIDPIGAARVAKSFGIKIYTIGAGTKGYVPFPMRAFGKKIYREVKIDIDEEILEQVAYTTDGTYYRATDTSQLKDIYEEIDLLEKTEIEELGYFEYVELYDRFLSMALGLLFLEILLSYSVFLKVP